MSAAAAVATASDASTKLETSPAKKLVLIAAVLALLLAGAGGGAWFMLKKRGTDEAGDELASAQQAAPKHDAAEVPTFLPLESFTVNLADKDQERYAQVSITLEVDDAKFAEQLKAYMPAVRNGVLMILAHKTSAELLERAGKEKLAAQIMREAVRPLGLEIDDDADPAPVAAGASAALGGEDASKKKKKKAVHNPVRHVHFTNFIIQ